MTEPDSSQTDVNGVSDQAELPLLIPAAARTGAIVTFHLDGRRLTAHKGESVLAAALQNGCKLRHSEFTGEPRAGFCLMNACQDCWIWTAQGQRLRACSTPVADGLDLHTRVPGTPDGR
ncbi:MAG: (2Fe-2S)-binding protein [Tepidamorphaceae bacterium]|nr:(2Fe-2S)-binding protein [Rhodobiaceae bacterium]MCC0048022.1 (2Fe-2S)-binding protein [Rhodobiaceae bacterium]